MAKVDPESLSSRLRHRVGIEAPPRPGSVDALGGPVEAWQLLTNTWAEVKSLSGRELWQAQQMQAEASHTVTIRWRPGIDRTMRVNFKGQLLYIDAAIDPDGLRLMIVLYCREPR